MFDFLALPGEIRNFIYEHLLVKEPVVPWAKKQRLYIDLAYTNKAISREYTSLLYSQTLFDFSQDGFKCGHACRKDKCQLPRTANFLQQIGHNAEHIRYIYTQFPVSHYNMTKNEYSLAEHSHRFVELIRGCCPNLKGLTLGPICTYAEYLCHTAFEDKDLASMLLSLVDNHFMTIPSLESILVEIPHCEPYIDLVDEIRKLHGWRVEVIPPFELPKPSEGPTTAETIQQMIQRIQRIREALQAQRVEADDGSDESHEDDDICEPNENSEDEIDYAYDADSSDNED